MKYYTKPDKSVWAFEPDGSQDDLITPDMALMSEVETEAHRATKVDPEEAQRGELENLESQITPLMLAEAFLSGDTEALRGLVQRIKTVKSRKATK